MSSNIEVQRICQHCGKEFTARTTVTRYCSHTCSQKAYKARLRNDRVEESNAATLWIRTKTIEELKVKEFLTVREVAELLNCSVRTVYYQIDNGLIKAVNLGTRMTRIRRSDVDKLFDQPENEHKPIPERFDITDSYTLSEVQDKYGISEKALYDLIRRNGIPKIKKGWFAYVPKHRIDELLA